MNPADVLMYGHQHVLRTLDGLDFGHWENGGVCGVWSVRDIVNHLASYEYLLIEILSPFAGEQTPQKYLDHLMNAGVAAFNDETVDARRDLSPAEALAAYGTAYAKVAALADKTPPDTWRETGTLPWYGGQYSLDDYIVYQFYGHKREHCAQINVYRDTLEHGVPPL